MYCLTLAADAEEDAFMRWYFEDAADAEIFEKQLKNALRDKKYFNIEIQHIHLTQTRDYASELNEAIELCQAIHDDSPNFYRLP